MTQLIIIPLPTSTEVSLDIGALMSLTKLEALLTRAVTLSIMARWLEQYKITAANSARALVLMEQAIMLISATVISFHQQQGRLVFLYGLTQETEVRLQECLPLYSTMIMEMGEEVILTVSLL